MPPIHSLIYGSVQKSKCFQLQLSFHLGGFFTKTWGLRAGIQRVIVYFWSYQRAVFWRGQRIKRTSFFSFMISIYLNSIFQILGVPVWTKQIKNFLGFRGGGDRYSNVINIF